ncbi:MAG: NADH:flavin oxidoreductase [Micrococcales bacterium]|nr:NADH:flavin oxidoreductase [Micrococcales bacterium]
MTVASNPVTETPDPLAPAQLGPVTLRNRVLKTATFEGYAPDALVTQDLIDFHLAVGNGGVGMTTVAYLAVAPEGRTERRQIWWRPEALPGLRQLTDAVHATGAKVSAQIGHAGPVSDSHSTKLKSIAASRCYTMTSMGTGLDRPATADDIDRIIAAHAQAATWAVESGFDAVEVHLGHNYLASSFLSPRLNHRRDEFGGSIACRAEFPRRLLAAVRSAVGDRAAVLAKLNMEDGARRGLHPDESLAAARLFEADGNLDALELTGGSSLLNPMFLFKGDVPLAEFAKTQLPVVGVGLRVFGRGLFKHYPYAPLYFLDLARAFRAELHLPLVLIGGVTDHDGMTTAMAEGFEFVGMARALLMEPDLINRIAADRATRARCTHCNRCVPTIYSGTRCPLLDELEPVA